MPLSVLVKMVKMFLKIKFRSVVRYKDPCIMQCRIGSSRIMIDNKFIEISWGQHISTRQKPGLFLESVPTAGVALAKHWSMRWTRFG